MKTTILSNSKGISIVQGMVLSAVLAGTALVGTKLIQDQKLAQKGAETRDQVEILHERVIATLQDRFNCIETFSPYQNNTGNSSVTTIWSRIKGGSGAGKNKEFQISTSRLIEVEATRSQSQRSSQGNNELQSQLVTYMNGNVAIRRMFITNMTAPVAKFTIEYERLNQSATSRTKSGYGAKNILKTIDIVIQKSIASPHTFEGCYAVNTVGDEPTAVATPEEGIQGVCDDLGDNGCTLFTQGTKQFAQKFCEDMQSDGLMRWEANLNRCVFNLACGEGRVFAGIDAQGKKICRNVFTQMNMNQFLDAPTPCNLATHPRVRLALNNGKVRVECMAACTPSVNGGWSQWSPWSEWDNTCLYSRPPCGWVRSRTRTCTQPAPSCGGAECIGDDFETETSPDGPGCQPDLNCDVIKASVCANVDAGSDSCGNACGNGTKTAGCVKCEALSCHLGSPIHRTCYLDGTSKLNPATFSCGGEDGGPFQEDGAANQCNNPTLCR